MIKKYLRVLGALVLLTVLPAACATAPALAPLDQAADPLESRNRHTMAFNLFVDDILIEPVARGYDTVVPGAGRLVLRNVNDYISLPGSFVEAVLQLNLSQMRHIFARFFINTTLGGLGMLDPASEFGFTPTQEDFGQTLAVYGVPEGVYWVAPFLGPTSLRDVLSRPIDYLSNPLSFIKIPHHGTYFAVDTAQGLLDIRAQNLDNFATLKRESTDLYSTLRNVYRQKRNAAILNDDKGLQSLSDVD